MRGLPSTDASNLPSGVLIKKVVAIDKPVSGSVLQWDTPPPSRVMRNSARVRDGFFVQLGLNRPCAVAGKPVAPVIEPRIQGAFTEQGSKTRAVDKQIPVNSLAAV